MVSSSMTRRSCWVSCWTDSMRTWTACRTSPMWNSRTLTGDRMRLLLKRYGLEQSVSWVTRQDFKFQLTSIWSQKNSFQHAICSRMWHIVDFMSCAYTKNTHFILLCVIILVKNVNVELFYFLHFLSEYGNQWLFILLWSNQVYWHIKQFE